MLILLLATQAALADKCGSEVEWRASLAEAAADARKLKRPILWYVPETEGTTMDRKKLVDDYMMCGVWMMPGVIEMANERFVPVKAVARGKEAGEWGIERIKFFEPGIVILSHDFKPMHVLDGIWTQNEAWMIHMLHEAVNKKYKGEKPAGREPGDEEARYTRGAEEFLAGRSDDARETWKRLFDEKPDSRWAWKAAAEYAGRGPLVHGFECLTPLPEDVFGKPPRSTSFPRDKKDAAVMISRGVEWLLSHQKQNGAWDDSTYVFGGPDSVPNVNMAVTALVAAALLEHRDVAPERVDAALEKAWAYLDDEKNMALDDKDELIWGYVYRLDAFARRGAKDKLNELVKLVEAQQNKNGSFRHEYANPFATASVIIALEQARAAGADVSPDAIKNAAAWLEKKRDDRGTFSYDASGRGFAVEGSAGRMPTCELGLLIAGRSDEKRLRAAVDASFAHHDRIEAVRKFDDHTDEFQNGGFFFWYDLYGRSLAIERLKGAARDKSREALRKIVFEIGELDGSWVDSHELGKSYGTACALLILKLP